MLTQGLAIDGFANRGASVVGAAGLTLEPVQVGVDALQDGYEYIALILTDAGEDFRACGIAHAPDLIQKRLGLRGEIKTAGTAVRRIRPTLEQPIRFHPVQDA